ncbi:MAG: inner membrane protein [Candidatus Methanofastidiosum methylothiophilum]|uniref:Inner membrane protein n=1 Tax=Candidatus Methanofastidiosum methylothiophilum TaxID=1705564 RepID=A0A150J423_9EURY|nr:MAG: inner membrane protein [Candidatus Methanofastidiosum methylthiophilus]
MKRRTHIALGMLSTGVILLILIALGVRPEMPIGDLIILGGIFGIIPDIDILIRKHRNKFTHSILASIITFLIIFLLSIIKPDILISNFFTWDSALVAAAAVLSHNLADSLTSWGVPLYFPISKRQHVHFPIIGGTVLLIYDFSWITLFLMVVLVILSLAGNALVRGLLTCSRCKQRELGCPAEKLFQEK